MAIAWSNGLEHVQDESPVTDASVREAIQDMGRECAAFCGMKLVDGWWRDAASQKVYADLLASNPRVKGLSTADALAVTE